MFIDLRQLRHSASNLAIWLVLIFLCICNLKAQASCDLVFKYASSFHDEQKNIPVQVSEFSATTESTLSEHRVFSTPILPGSAYIDLMLSNIKRFASKDFDRIAIENLTIQDRFLLPTRAQSNIDQSVEHDSRKLYTVTTFGDRKKINFQTNIMDSTGKIFANSSTGKFSKNNQFHPLLATDVGSIKNSQEDNFYFGRERLYEILNTLGLNYGSNFQLLDFGRANLNQNFVQASIMVERLKIEDVFANNSSITPHILDASFHAVAAWIVGKFNSEVFSQELSKDTHPIQIQLKHVYVPMQFGEIFYRPSFKYTDYSELLVRARIVDPPSENWNINPPKRVFYDLDILTPDQKAVLQIRNGTLVMVTPAQINSK